MTKQYKAFLNIQHFISNWSFESNRDYMNSLGKSLSIIDKALKALEIIKKYVSVEDSKCSGELFDYFIEDKQYISSRSCNVISKEEYELLKEVLCDD